MIFDLHNDFPTAYPFERYKTYLEDCAKLGVTVTGAIWTSEFGPTAKDRVEKISYDLLCGSRPQKCYLAIEDIGFLAERDAYGNFDFGRYAYCSLTWNYDNAFAGGALDGGGLTKKGRSVIEYINRSGCALDLAHLNKKSFLSALDLACKPVCSHTGFNDHPRSLDDERIRALVARNGVIGICAVSAFTGACDMAEFVTAIDGFVQKYGVDGLAIGTDFNGSTDIPKDMDDYGKLCGLRYGLLSRGYSDRDVKKILYYNAIRAL